MTNWDTLTPLFWAFVGAVVTSGFCWVHTPAASEYRERGWDPDPPESPFSRVLGFAPGLVYVGLLIVTGVALIASTVFTVGKLYQFFEGFWPFSWIWPTVLLVVWLPCGFAGWCLAHGGREVDGWIESPTLAVGAVMCLAAGVGILMTVGQWVTALNHALAPITVGGLLALAVALWFATFKR